MTELSEANSYLKYIGLVFMIIGILYIFDLVDLNNLTIVSFSFAGILFVIKDFIEFRLLQLNKKFKVDRLKIGLLKFLNEFLIFIALIALILVPFLEFDFLSELADKLSIAFTFIAIGLTIFRLGFHYEEKLTDFYSKLADETVEIFNEFESLKKENEEEKY